ncbi:MAG: hypothetical protein PHT76_07940 [Anaerostipes sp.]|nr:hypothetical protein [Anaerostipes sp.]
MKKKILFSAIGSTDPIRNGRDGGMLHICRKYRPDVVYLYLSKEMCERHEKDNRYLYCIQQLGKILNHEFEVHLFQKNNLVEVQVFDLFLEEFREILNQIRKKNPDADILLNISSGTPAMKSALQVLSAVSEISMTSIQVSTPVKSLNLSEDEIDDYEAYWEINEDNCDDYEDRCMESLGINMLDVVKRESIIKQVRACNYVVAQELADTLVRPFDDEILELLQAAKSRLELDHIGVIQALQGLEVCFYPVSEEKKRMIFEYVLSLEIKIRKSEYADFVRALSPAIVEVFKLALGSYTNINYKDYLKNNAKIEKWDLNKLKKNQRMLKALKDYFCNFKEGPVYAVHFLPLFKEYCSNKKVSEIGEKLRKVEEKARNIAAHNICSVTEQWMKAKVGYTPVEIYKLLQEFINLLNFKIEKDDWNSYDRMNEIIIKKIQEQ